jgi:hypothetical protein
MAPKRPPTPIKSPNSTEIGKGLRRLSGGLRIEVHYPQRLVIGQPQGERWPRISVNSANIACFQHCCKKSHRLRVSRDLAGHGYSGDVKKIMQVNYVKYVQNKRPWPWFGAPLKSSP